MVLSRQIFSLPKYIKTFRTNEVCALAECSGHYFPSHFFFTQKGLPWGYEKMLVRKNDIRHIYIYYIIILGPFLGIYKLEPPPHQGKEVFCSKLFWVKFVKPNVLAYSFFLDFVLKFGQQHHQSEREKRTSEGTTFLRWQFYSIGGGS